jgi:hypothetical protein
VQETRKGDLKMSKFCTSCGAALEEGQQFCGSCGKPAQGNGTAGAPYSTAGANAAANSEQTKLFVFWLFLGWLGVHCFAAGKKKRGTVELVLGLIATIVWIGRGIYAIAAASSYSYSDVEDMINTTWVLLAVAGVFFALFCTMWIPDLIGIVKGRFANAADEWPTLIKAGLPEWKFTQKHLVFIAALAVLEIATVVTKDVLILPGLLAIPVLLCGAFFGPLLGTVIAGAIPSIIRGLPLFISGAISEMKYDGPAAPSPGGVVLPFLPYVIWTVVIGCIVRRCNPKIRASWKLLPFLGALISGCLALLLSIFGALSMFEDGDFLLVSTWFTAFISGYIVYPKIRASKNRQGSSNKTKLGLLIGIAVLVG